MSLTARRRKQTATAAAEHKHSETEAVAASTSGRQYPYFGLVAWGILLILGMFWWRSSTGDDDHVSRVGARQSISSNGLKPGQHYAVVSPLKQEDHLRQLPDWMQSYIRWHSEMRQKYSDDALVQVLQNRNATRHYTQDLALPPLLIRQCRKVCGGFNDRLGQLEWDIYVAYRTRRLLFLWWESPPDWTDLLQVPTNGWNLTMPQGLKELSLVTGLASSAREKKQSLLLWPHLKQEGNLNTPNWSQRLEDALDEDLHTVHHRRPLVKFRLTAHEGMDRLDDLLAKHGMARRRPDTYAHLFALAFSPMARIQRKVDATLERLMIQEGEDYWALHLRTRYPPELLKYDKNMSVPLPSLQDGQTADESGLLWDPIRYPQTTEWILRQVYSAVVCMDQRWTASVNSREPRPLIYLLADSADVVKYLTVDLANKSPDACSRVEQKLLALAPRFVSHQGIGMQEVLHMDKQRGRAVDSYDSILVDLFVASKSQRLAIGAGSFGSLAGKIGHLDAESILNYMDDSKCEGAIS